MKKNKNMVLASAGWSVLVLAVLMAAEPAARSGTIIFALLLLIAGLLIAVTMASGKGVDESRFIAASQAERGVIEHSSQAIIRVSTEFSEQIKEVRGEVTRAQTIFNEAIGSLISSFHGIMDRYSASTN